MFDHACARAVLARWVAGVFHAPEPADDSGAQPARDDDGLLGAARCLGMPDGLLQRALHAPGDGRERAARYRHLFGHAVRGACPLYELEYARGEVFQQGHALADLGGFYRAFGLGMSPQAHERLDHAAAEWEFLAMLAWKEALAIAWRDGHAPAPAAIDVHAAIDTCRGAQRAFLRDHAAAWMPALFARVQRADPDGAYGRAARTAEWLLRNWCDEFELPFGPAWLELRPVEEDDLSIECGPGPEPGRVRLGAGLAAALGAGEPHEAFD